MLCFLDKIALMWQELLKTVVSAKIALFWQKLLETLCFRQNGCILVKGAQNSGLGYNGSIFSKRCSKQ